MNPKGKKYMLLVFLHTVKLNLSSKTFICIGSESNIYLWVSLSSFEVRRILNHSDCVIHLFIYSSTRFLLILSEDQGSSGERAYLRAFLRFLSGPVVKHAPQSAANAETRGGRGEGRQSEKAQ